MRFVPVVDWPNLPMSLELVDVVAIDVDGAGNFYVFNRGRTPVVVLDAAGRVQAMWGEGVFTEPHGIHIGSDGSVFCVDYGDHTVRRFSPDGELLATIGTPGRSSDTGVQGRDWTTVQRAGLPFNAPTDIATGPTGDLYVSDGYGNARVHRFDREGELQMSWGTPGSASGEFNLPHSIALGSNGLLHVSDRENNRVQRFTLDGEFVSELPGVHRPNDALPAPDGFTYVAELGYRTIVAMRLEAPPGRPHSAVSVFAPDDTLVARIGSEDPTKPGSFCAAHSVAMDSNGDLYVGDVGWSAHAGSPPLGIRAIQKLARSG